MSYTILIAEDAPDIIDMLYKALTWKGSSVMEGILFSMSYDGI